MIFRFDYVCWYSQMKERHHTTNDLQLRFSGKQSSGELDINVQSNSCN